MNTESRPERWVWTELIGFDNRSPDFGVRHYIQTAGFVPDAVSLLVTSPDFALQHEGMEKERLLPPDFCAREAHEHNRQRPRQAWSNHQIRGLVHELRRNGAAVYLSFFTGYREDRFHHEWVSDHPEVRCGYPRRRIWGGLNPLKRLRDGRFFQDILADALVATLGDYGFDGWHGPDGYGPHNGPLHELDYTDDIWSQFMDFSGIAVPAEIQKACDGDWDRLLLRAEWGWRNVRSEWIAFYAARWAGFWKRIAGALHGTGRKAVMNSAWGRAPFEALYRYGIDYRRMADVGVDAMVVETAAAGLALDPRPNCTAPERHYDFLSMLMLVRARAPEMKLIFLHNVQDVVEQWDILRHAPALLEKEIFSLANTYATGSDNRLRRCADGFLVCLADAISHGEWEWLRSRWALAFEGHETRPVGATLVWSDQAVLNQIDDFIRTRRWFTHRILFHLLSCGAPVHAVANVRDVERVTGPILVLNPHLYPPEELDAVMRYEGGPIVMLGGRPTLTTPPEAEFKDTCSPRTMWCGVFRWQRVHAMPSLNSSTSGQQDFADIEEPKGYWDHFVCHDVSLEFLHACARLIADCAGAPVCEDPNVTPMALELAPGRLRVAIKSKQSFYVGARVDLRRAIRRVEVKSEFPRANIVAEGSTFSVRVPPRGIVVLDVEVAP